jgi:hypothetical protein
VDLCTASQCIDARITDRQDLESAHEATHRLVKTRINVLSRNYGYVHTSACKAFQNVREFCMKIAESSLYPRNETGQDEQKLSNLEPAPTEMPVMGGKLDESDVRTTEDGTKNGAASDSAQVQGQEKDLPTCGKCKGSLSFPFWYCIFCEGRSQR